MADYLLLSIAILENVYVYVCKYQLRFAETLWTCPRPQMPVDLGPHLYHVARPQRRSQRVADDRSRTPRPRLCCAAHSVTVYRPSHLLDLGLPVPGSHFEDNDNARGLEDGVFRHVLTVNVHVAFVYRCCPTFYSCTPLHLCHVRRPPWLAGPNSAWVVFSQMLQLVYREWSLYTRLTVEKNSYIWASFDIAVAVGKTIHKLKCNVLQCVAGFAHCHCNVRRGTNMSKRAQIHQKLRFRPGPNFHLHYLATTSSGMQGSTYSISRQIWNLISSNFVLTPVTLAFHILKGFHSPKYVVTVMVTTSSLLRHGVHIIFWEKRWRDRHINLAAPWPFRVAPVSLNCNACIITDKALLQKKVHLKETWGWHLIEATEGSYPTNEHTGSSREIETGK